LLTLCYTGIVENFWRVIAEGMDYGEIVLMRTQIWGIACLFESLGADVNRRTQTHRLQSPKLGMASLGERGWQLSEDSEGL